MPYHFHAIHKNGFALKLALKQRHKGTRKWSVSLKPRIPYGLDQVPNVPNRSSNLRNKFVKEKLLLPRVKTSRKIQKSNRLFSPQIRSSRPSFAWIILSLFC